MIKIRQLPSMLQLFHDPKPTVVRQCLNAIKEVIIYCPELYPDIIETVKQMDLTQYKDSMVSLRYL